MLCAPFAASAMVDPATPTNAVPANGDTSWTLDFSDEFNGSTLDSGKWSTVENLQTRTPRWDRGIYSWFNRPNNVYLNGTGNLVLDVVKEAGTMMGTGSIVSQGKYEPTYGYVETRIKIADTTKDITTAFWLYTDAMPQNISGTGNDGAEIDIFESAWFGDFTKSVVHIDGYGAYQQSNTNRYETPELHVGYHTFGMEWNEHTLNIYYDGVLKSQYEGIWVPQVAEFLRVSTGASFGDIGTFSEEPIGLLSSAEVDYVRAWKQTNPSILVLVGGDKMNGNFNADPGELVAYRNTAGWYNLGAGEDQTVVATRMNNTYDGSQNATIATQATRNLALNTGYSMVEGDSFDFSYVWKDDWNWVDASDEVRVTLFVTSDNTLAGTRTNLVSDLSGVSTVNNSYEAVDRYDVYTATASDAGKALFVLIDGNESESGGFGRIDNFSLIRHSPEPPNVAPIWNFPPTQYTASAGTFWNHYNAWRVSDPESDSITWAIVSGPEWLSINPNTGELRGTPGSADVGTTQITISITDGFNPPIGATADITVDPAPEPDGIKLVNDIVTGVGSSWQTVTLPQSYNSMVVVAGVVLDSASDPVAVTRIRNASGNSFELMVQNPGGTALSGRTVHYMVVEEGTYTVAEDGVNMEAVKYVSTVTDRKDSWNAESRTYANSYTAPVVLGQVMTANDANWSAFWCSNGSTDNPPSSSALSTGKHVGEDPLTSRANETIGYIVIESGSGTIDGFDFVAALGDDIVRGVTDGAPFSYTISLTNARVGIVTQAAMDGNDGGHAHLYGTAPVSDTLIDLVVDEDTLGDSERAHTTEQVGYLVFADAAVTNSAPAFTSNPVAETAATANSAYSATLADDASDPETDPLTFLKLSGPNWLTVASDGSLGGTPATSDVGLNSFSVQVDANGGSDSATLEITVDADTTAPNPPSLTSADAAIGSVDLDWSDSGEADFETYTVYRSETQGGGYVPIAELLTSSDHTDGSAIDNTVYYYVVTATDDSGNESAFSNERSAQPGLVTDAPISEVSVDSSVAGSFVDVATSDNSYETLTEINNGTTSILEHVWVFDVTGAEIVTFYVEAHHSANTEGDDFIFAYSTDDVNYTPMLTVTKTADDNTAQYYTLPSGLSGTVYVRVHDADATPGHTQLDSLYVDNLVIESETSSVVPTAAAEPTPTDGAIDVGVEAELSWRAGLYAASHDVYFGTNPVPALQGNQTGTSYDPDTLLSDTTYYWSVNEVNATGTTVGPVWSFTTATGLAPDVLHWTFDEGSGSTATDAAGNARDGLISGAVWTTDTPDGSAYALDFATGDFVEDADAGNYLNGLAAVTVALWVKSDLTNTDKGYLLTNTTNSSDNRLGGRYDTAGWGGGGSNVIKSSISTTGGTAQLESASGAQTTAWQHIALTWADGGSLKLYIDGVETVYTDAPATVGGTLNNVTTLMIGRGAKDGGSGGWSGLIDDVRIYSSELTAAEIQTLAQ